MVTTAYATERELALYLDSELGGIADALGWSVPEGETGEYGRAIDATLRAVGVDAIADGDAAALEAVGLRETLRRAMREASTRFNVSVDGQSLTRSQLYTQIKEQYLDAVAAAAGYDDASGIAVIAVSHADDPYTWEPDEVDL